MIKYNFFTYFPVIILEFFGKILYFPLWWYSVGLFKKLKGLFNFLKDKEKELGLSVWAKNIFVPMYGQRDIAGRIISFFIRFFQIVFRSIVLLIWFVLAFFMLIVWLSFPVLLFIAIIFQIF